MDEKLCITCGKKIPQARLKALPGTQCCVKCSDVERKVGATVWDQNASDIVIMNQDELDRVNQLENSDGRMGRLK